MTVMLMFPPGEISFLMTVHRVTRTVYNPVGMGITCDHCACSALATTGDRAAAGSRRSHAALSLQHWSCRTSLRYCC